MLAPGPLNCEKIEKFSIASLAKVVEDKLGRPVQLMMMMNTASPEVKATSILQLLVGSSCW